MGAASRLDALEEEDVFEVGIGKFEATQRVPVVTIPVMYSMTARACDRLNRLRTDKVEEAASEEEEVANILHSDTEHQSHVAIDEVLPNVE